MKTITWISVVIGGGVPIPSAAVLSDTRLAALP